MANQSNIPTYLILGAVGAVALWSVMSSSQPRQHGLPRPSTPPRPRQPNPIPRPGDGVRYSHAESYPLLRTAAFQLVSLGRLRGDADDYVALNANGQLFVTEQLINTMLDEERGLNIPASESGATKLARVLRSIDSAYAARR